MDEMTYELLNLVAEWDRASARFLERANRLGNCRAGEVAAAESGTFKRCADDVRKAIAVVEQTVNMLRMIADDIEDGTL